MQSMLSGANSFCLICLVSTSFSHHGRVYMAITAPPPCAGQCSGLRLLLHSPCISELTARVSAASLSEHVDAVPNSLQLLA